MVEWMTLTDHYRGREIRIKPATVVKLKEIHQNATEVTFVYAGEVDKVTVTETIAEVHELMFYKPFWSWRK